MAPVSKETYIPAHVCGCLSEVFMIFTSRWAVTLSLLLLPLFHASAQTYGTELNLGVQAYRNSHYDEAIQHFRKATELNPSQPIAHLYLATACTSQYIPGVDSPDNKAFGELAIEQYLLVLGSDAARGTKIASTKGVAYLYLNMKKFEDSKDYYRKASGLDPDDPEPYYSIGVIDWTVAYQSRMEARARLEMRPDENLNRNIPEQRKACAELSARNNSTIDEAIESLNKAIALRPDYDDAMAYVNLMYREKADLECDDLNSRARDLKTADDWVDKTMAVKKAKANKASAPTAPSPQ